ncbi:MAG: Ni/Fe hydrogenase subunit gamma, partial [Bacteroidota bacterium]
TDLLPQQDSFQNTVALVCGPEIMMRFCAYALLDWGLASEDIYVSMERNMKCALGFCGRCQYGPYFVCHDGPVFSFDRVERLFKIREV